MDQHQPNSAAGAETEIRDEAATRVASSPPPASPPPFARGEDSAAETEPLQSEALEPEEAPSRPHGDPLAAAVEDDERGADQDPEEVEPELIQRELEELTAKAARAEEYLQLAQRTRADFENFRKRAAREARAAQERGVAKLAKELLPAVDNLDRALAAVQAGAAPGADQAADNGTTANLVSGIKLVHADVIAALGRVGIEPYSPEGETFDPQHHEAVAQQPVEGATPGTVVEVYQRGYRLGDVILRPARVVVAG